MNVIKNLKAVFLLTTMVVLSTACTVEKEASVVKENTVVDNDSLKEELSNKMGLEIDAIAESPIDGLLQLYTDRGLFYASDDGSHFLQARIFSVTDGIVDETENALKDVRLSGMEQFSQSAIVFKAPDEKFEVSVFTDATCGYCRKLHREIQQYLDLGITVRYFAYPRAGINSENYRNTVSIWCAENPNEAMNSAKAGQEVASAWCENDVAEQFKFGRKVGVNGTPNIILPDGSIVPGYQPAPALFSALSQASS